MKIWVFCFILLFGAAELLQWIRQFSLPLPIFILGGVFLAVASNYDKLRGLPFHLDHEELEPNQEDGSRDRVNQIQQNAQAPSSTKPFEPSISFTIQKPFRPGD